MLLSFEYNLLFNMKHATDFVMDCNTVMLSMHLHTYSTDTHARASFLIIKILVKALLLLIVSACLDIRYIASTHTDSVTTASDEENDVRIKAIVLGPSPTCDRK